MTRFGTICERKERRGEKGGEGSYGNNCKEGMKVQQRHTK
jgi:hypothetical protein